MTSYRHNRSSQEESFMRQVTHRFEKRSIIHAPTEKIFTYLAEPANDARLQPLVIGVEDVNREQNAQGQPVIRYTSIERIMFGSLIPYHNRIHVVRTLDPQNNQVISDVTGQFGVRLRSVYTLKAVKNGTEVRETVDIQVSFLIARFVIQQAKSAHDQLFINLKNQMEQPG